MDKVTRQCPQTTVACNSFVLFLLNVLRSKSIAWHAKNPVPFYTQSNTNKKLTRIRLFDPYLCCMSCGCMFVCLPS